VKLIVLGTSSGRPTLRRNVSSCALAREGEWMLLDCGEGTQMQLLRTGLRLSRLRYVLITHLHGDHVLGLPGLLGTLNLSHHEQPITIVGPPGIARFVREVSKAIYFRPVFPLDVVEVEPGLVLANEAFTVEARRLTHHVLAYGYAIQERPRPGRFDVLAAAKLGIPAGPLYGRLQRGEAVELEDGRRIESSAVVGPPRHGLRVAYCTDTGPCENSVQLARGADLLVHEATYMEEMSSEARERGHSTAADAARIARDAGARQLLITHFSPRYEDVGGLLAEARQVFPRTTAAYDRLELVVGAGVECPVLG
jgi:ribonuclease Z